MTNEQKQKVMQLLELCIDNSKRGEYEATFSAYPSNDGSVSVKVYIGIELNAAIEAIRTLPERATALIAAKEAARREKLLKEYEEVFVNKN